MIPEILKKPLVFGNNQQYRALKSLEEKESWCDECCGEGEISTKCRGCEGTGKKPTQAGGE